MAAGREQREQTRLIDWSELIRWVFRTTGKYDHRNKQKKPSSPAPTTPTQSAQHPDLAGFPASQGPSRLWLIFPQKSNRRGSGHLRGAAHRSWAAGFCRWKPYFFYSTHCLGRCTPRLTSASRPEAPGHAPSVAHSWFAVDSEEALEDPMVSPASFPFKREGRG